MVPNLAHNVMVLVNLVRLVSALGYAHVMIVVSGEPFESLRKPTYRTSELQGWFVSRERVGTPRETPTTSEGNPKQISQNQIRRFEI